MPAQKGRPHAGELLPFRGRYREIQNVALELHQEFVLGGAAVHPQLLDGHAGLLAHQFQHVGDLIGDALLRGLDDFRPPVVRLMP